MLCYKMRTEFLPVELSVEISGKALLLSVGVMRHGGRCPSPTLTLSVASVVTDFRG